MMDASQKKKRMKNAKMVENLRRARQNLSYQGELLLKWAAEAGMAVEYVECRALVIAGAGSWAKALTACACTRLSTCHY